MSPEWQRRKAKRRKLLEEGSGPKREGEDGEEGKEVRFAKIQAMGEKTVRWARPLCTYRGVEGRTVSRKRRNEAGILVERDGEEVK